MAPDPQVAPGTPLNQCRLHRTKKPTLVRDPSKAAALTRAGLLFLWFQYFQSRVVVGRHTAVWRRGHQGPGTRPQRKTSTSTAHYMRQPTHHDVCVRERDSSVCVCVHDALFVAPGPQTTNVGFSTKKKRHPPVCPRGHVVTCNMVTWSHVTWSRGHM